MMGLDKEVGPFNSWSLGFRPKVDSVQVQSQSSFSMCSSSLQVQLLSRQVIPHLSTKKVTKISMLPLSCKVVYSWKITDLFISHFQGFEYFWKFQCIDTYLFIKESANCSLPSPPLTSSSDTISLNLAISTCNVLLLTLLEVCKTVIYDALSVLDQTGANMFSPKFSCTKGAIKNQVSVASLNAKISEANGHLDYPV